MACDHFSIVFDEGKLQKPSDYPLISHHDRNKF